MRNHQTPATLFLRIAAGLFGAAALSHLWRTLSPQSGDPSAALRHGLFVVINLVVAVCLWRESPVLKYVFGLLVAQQVYSHGGSAWTVWFEHHEVDVVSIVIVVLLPVTLAVLWRRQVGREGVGA